MDFYNRVKLLVKKRGITLSVLCESIGLKLPTYNSLRQKNNLPRLDVAMAIADYLDVSLEWLAYGKQHDKVAVGALSEIQNEIVEAVTRLPPGNLESVAILVKGLLAADRESKKESFA